MIELIFWIDPVPKKRPRVCKGGWTYTTKETVIYENAIKAMAWTQMQNTPILKCAIIIWVDFYFKKPKSSKNKHHVVRPDNDNLQKSIFDALNGICWNDDAQIIEIHSRKLYGEKSKIHLRVYTHDEATFVF